MKRLYPFALLLVFFVLPLALSGCSSRFNCTRLETLLGSDVNLISLGREIGDELISRSFPPLMPRQPEQPVLVTTLVNNENLRESSSFGRSLQNAVAAEFVRQGFVVNEVKLRSDVSINAEEGEFMLSRELDVLEGKQRAQAVVVGTYTMANRVMYLSVRLVEPDSGVIRSVFEQRICLDENSLRMLGLEFLEEEGVDPPGESLLDSLLY